MIGAIKASLACISLLTCPLMVGMPRQTNKTKSHPYPELPPINASLPKNDIFLSSQNQSVPHVNLFKKTYDHATHQVTPSTTEAAFERRWPYMNFSVDVLEAALARVQIQDSQGKETISSTSTSKDIVYSKATSFINSIMTSKTNHLTPKEKTELSDLIYKLFEQESTNPVHDGDVLKIETAVNALLKFDDPNQIQMQMFDRVNQRVTAIFGGFEGSNQDEAIKFGEQFYDNILRLNKVDNRIQFLKNLEQISSRRFSLYVIVITPENLNEMANIWAHRKCAESNTPDTQHGTALKAYQTMFKNTYHRLALVKKEGKSKDRALYYKTIINHIPESRSNH